MTSMWLDDTDFSAAELDDTEMGEAFDDSEFDGDFEDYDQEARASARTRARQRRIALARRRQALARTRGRRARPTAATPRTPAQAVTAIRNLDLETKVQGDTFRSVIATQNRRMSRSEYSAVAGAAVGQFIESFDAPDNPYVRATLRFAPLLLLSPMRRGTGLEGFVKDPRVLGAAAVAGITFAGENRNQFTKASTIRVASSSELAAGEQERFVADVYDLRGRLVPAASVRWESDDQAVATVDPSSGRVTATGAGRAVISAISDGIITRVSVKVTPSGSAGPTRVRDVRVVGLPQVTVGADATFFADLLDENGAPVLNEMPTWESSDTNKATVDASGKVTGVAKGKVFIIANAGGRPGFAQVEVV